LVELAIPNLGTDDATAQRVAAIESLIGGVAAARQDPHEISPLFHALVIALRQAGPVLLAIDDADLTDRETLAVLQYLVRRLENQQIWVLVSARPLHPGVGLRPIESLLTEPEIRQFHLEPLGEQSVGVMLEGFFGEEPHPEFVRACYEATGGTPLFVKALLSALGRRRIHPTLESAATVERMHTPKITQFVLGRLSHLSVAASDLLQACAILGERADPSVARQLAKIDALAAERAADAAAQVELVRPGRPITFISPLIRWAIYFDIPTARRSQFHARAARLLAEHGADVATVAEHLLATEPSGDLETADRLRQMGRTALAAGDADLSLRCLNRALAESPPPEQLGPMNLDLASTKMALGNSSSLVHFRRAIQLGVTDDAELIRVAIGLLRHQTHAPQLRSETVRTVRGLKNRLDAVDHDLRIEFELALTMASRHPAERSQGLVRIKGLLAEPGTNLHVMSRMAGIYVDIHEAAASAISSEELADRLMGVVGDSQLPGSDPIANRVQAMACLGLLCADRFEAVDLVRREPRAGVQPPNGDQGEVIFLPSAMSMLWQGALIEAEAESRRGIAGAQARSTIGLVDALVGQGKIDEANDVSDSMTIEYIEDSILRGLARLERSRLLLASDRRDEGLEELLGIGDEAVSGGIVNPALNPWRADAAMVLATLDEWDEADRLADEHLELARSFGAVRTIGIGLRAKAAATRDLFERSERLVEAVDLLEHSLARLELANALVELGTALVDRKKKKEARSVLRRGANIASMCGAHQLVETAGVQLRAAGARPRRLGYRGPESLTPAELRVVRLAAVGKTNQGIASDLYISVKTVEGHLAKAYRKLGVDSRRELAAALVEDDEFLEASSL
jgi:DNA-binding CsgD family transcriptional regulator